MTATAGAGRERTLTGWHVLGILVAGFGFVFAVNGFMAALAIGTFSGLDGDDSYQSGLEYNRTMAEADAQLKLGWHSAVSLAPGGKNVQVAMKDREGAAIHGLTVTGTIGRAATNKFDRSLTFKETSPGIYTATEGPSGPGSWVVSLSALRLTGNELQTLYRLKERLWLKPSQT
jgi:nitrogen fixation protein FixH